MVDPGVISEVTFQRDSMSSEDSIINPYASAHEDNFMSYSQKYLPADVLNPDRNYATAHFVLNDNHMIISRSDYTVLSYIGDVGALLGTLQLISSVILLNVFQINILAENDLLVKVFRLRKKHYKTEEFKITYV